MGPRPYGSPLMPEIDDDPPLLSCYHLFLGPGNQKYQRLSPDLSSRLAGATRGRFAKGSSGNPPGGWPSDDISWRWCFLAQLRARTDACTGRAPRASTTRRRGISVGANRSLGRGSTKSQRGPLSPRG